MTIRNWPAAVAVAALVFVFGSVAVESSVSIDVAGRSLSAYRDGGILVPGVNRMSRRRSTWRCWMTEANSMTRKTSRAEVVCRACQPIQALARAK